MADLKEQATDGKTYLKLGKSAYEKSGVFKIASSGNATGRTHTSMWFIYPKLGKIGLKMCICCTICVFMCICCTMCVLLIYQGLEEENLDQKSPGPPGWGLMQRASSSLITKNQKMLKKPNTNPRKSDGDRRLKLRNRTFKFGETERNGVWFPEDGDSCYKPDG